MLGNPGVWPAKGASAAQLAAAEAAAENLFPTITLCNWYYSSTEALFESLSQQELAQLSALYSSHGGNVQELMNIAAAFFVASNGVGAADLRRLASAFGEAVVQNAVNNYSPADIKEAYAAAAQPAAVPLGLADIQARSLKTVIPSPQLNWSLTDIYLDYRTAGFTMVEASAAAATYSAAPAYLAYSAGNAVGNGIVYLWPSLPENIGALLCDVLCPGVPVPSGKIIVGDPVPDNPDCGDWGCAPQM